MTGAPQHLNTRRIHQLRQNSQIRQTGQLGQFRQTLRTRGLVRWAGAVAVVQSWAAAASLIELHAEGIRRLALTLPVAIIALVDSWQELRTPQSTPNEGSTATNHAGVTAEK